MKKISLLFTAFCAAIVSASAQSAAKVIYVGMLEDRQPAVDGEKFRSRVKVLFAEQSGHWSSLYKEGLGGSQFPKSTNWTVAFDGKNLGSLKGTRPERYELYTDVGEQTIEQQSVPHIGARAEKWTTFAGEPIYRPLVVVSEPNYKDPDQWKHVKPSADAVKIAKSEFKKHFAKTLDLRDKGAHATRYSVDHLVIDSYGSKNGAWLLMTSLKVRSEDDPDAEGDAPGCLRLPVAITKANRVVILPEKDSAVVDAGDYDGDGRSELVLATVGYDLGGYALYSDEFKLLAKFEFTYH